VDQSSDLRVGVFSDGHKWKLILTALENYRNRRAFAQNSNIFASPRPGDIKINSLTMTVTIDMEDLKSSGKWGQGERLHESYIYVPGSPTPNQHAVDVWTPYGEFKADPKQFWIM
jgi:hypothetical protein